MYSIILSKARAKDLAKSILGFESGCNHLALVTGEEKEASDRHFGSDTWAYYMYLDKGEALKHLHDIGHEHEEFIPVIYQYEASIDSLLSLQDPDKPIPDFRVLKLGNGKWTILEKSKDTDFYRLSDKQYETEEKAFIETIPLWSSRMLQAYLNSFGIYYTVKIKDVFLPTVVRIEVENGNS